MEEPQENENESKRDTPQNNNNDVEENNENIINNTLPFKYLEKDNSPEKILFLIDILFNRNFKYSFIYFFF